MRNVEGLSAFDIPRWRERQPGLSAMVRLKNEAEFVLASLNSIADWCDEIVIALQGRQTDGTDTLVREWRRGRGNVQVLVYPFDSRPNGPGHSRQLRHSIYERAYFYNWTMAHCTRRHVMKWDGDMVAVDGLSEQVRGVVDGNEDGLRFAGWELAALDPPRLSKTHVIANDELRVFRVDSGTRYQSGSHCEQLVWHGNPVSLREPGYLHFKWCKSRESATQAWPTDWQESAHFRAIYARAEPGDLFPWPLPEGLHG